MGRNLGPLNIKDSYEGLVQISGSLLTDGSGSLIPSLDVTASFATSASHAIFADTAGFATDVNALYTASVVDATISFLKGGGGTFPITVNNVANAVSASYATTASFALTASALVGGVSLQSVLDTGNTATQDINLTGDINATNITASYATFTSASIGFLQTITGSAVIIGDEFVVLNANTPTLRYSGLQVYDSGSAATASFEWDGQQDIWIQVDETGLSGVMLTGVKGTKGAEAFPTANAIQKGNGDSTLSNSSITDNGTLVSITTNISASGYVSASAFIGDGSQLTGIDTFPYTGSAEISGSLRVLTDGVIDGYSITSGSLSGSLVDNLGQQSVGTTTAIKHMVYCTQAEYDALTPDANTLYVIDGSETLGNTTISGSLIGEVKTISDAAGTTTLDCSLGNYFTLAMPAGGTTALTPTNIQIGQTINIKITQNATAAALTYAASIVFPDGTAFTISTGSGEVDILTLVSFDGTTLQATGLANFS